MDRDRQQLQEMLEEISETVRRGQFILWLQAARHHATEMEVLQFITGHLCPDTSGKITQDQIDVITAKLKEHRINLAAAIAANQIPTETVDPAQSK